MAKRLSYFRQTLGRLKKTFFIIRQEEKLVGEDHLGNKYFEKVEDIAKGLKSQRRVEPIDPDQWKVPEVPVEWMAWLQNRTDNPPTTETIERNIQNMLKIKMKAEELEKERLKEDSKKPRDEVPISQSDRVPFPQFKDYETVAGEFENKNEKIGR